MDKNNATNLVMSMLLSALALIVGSVPIIFTDGATWYQDTLSKPFFAPPGGAFGIVWAVLYFLMAIALYFVLSKWPANDAKMATSLYVAQLCLNVLWSFLFFGQRWILLGLIELVVLLAMVALTTYRFYQVDRRAGYLMAPYLLWVVFAACLNAAIWLMNPGAAGI